MLSIRTYDLVLTDLMMPDRNGMEVIEVVSRDHPEIGVVMFTGFATVESAVQSMKLGALDYLPKPFTPEELLDVIKISLEKTWKARRDREIEMTYAEAEKALTTSLDLREILNLICTSVVRLLKLKGAGLHVYRAKDKALEVASSCGLSDSYLKKGAVSSDQSITKVLESGRPVLIESQDFDTSLLYPEEARKEGVAAILSVPLKVEDTILGFLRLYSAEKRSFTDDEMDLLLKFAEQAARALENAIEYEKVKSDIEGMKKFIPRPVVRRMKEQS
jgi:YesN/AraC family two-component response regulator